MKTVTQIFQVWTNSMQLHESQCTEIKLKPRQMRHSLLTTKLPDKKWASLVCELLRFFLILDNNSWFCMRPRRCVCVCVCVCVCFLFLFPSLWRCCLSVRPPPPVNIRLARTSVPPPACPAHPAILEIVVCVCVCMCVYVWGGWSRSQKGGGEKAVAQEMMPPLGVKEAAGRRLIAPGSANVVYYVY